MRPSNRAQTLSFFSLRDENLLVCIDNLTPADEGHKMASLIGMIQRIRKAINPPAVTKDAKPLKFGILGAAAIAPPALIHPARNHPEVVVYAVAARSLQRAQAFATKHGVEKAYGSYQEMLDDPEIDIVYNPLPNSLHYEWTMKALAAGKHVLNEKPSADTAEETRAMFEFAEAKGLVLLDAYHYKHHPALHRVKEIVTSGEIGTVKHVSVNMELCAGIVGEGDIRYDYSLGGGALMDLGCYAISCAQFMTSSNPESVIAATYEPHIPKKADVSYVKNVDRRVVATLAMPKDVTATLTMDLCMPNKFGFIPQFPMIRTTIEGELGSVLMFNHVLPTLYHSITVKNKGGATRIEKVYKSKDGKDEEWWTTYRYQMEALVDKVKGREPKTWLTKEESVSTMEWIEKIYEKLGLGSRPKSTYVLV